MDPLVSVGSSIIQQFGFSSLLIKNQCCELHHWPDTRAPVALFSTICGFQSEKKHYSLFRIWLNVSKNCENKGSTTFWAMCNQKNRQIKKPATCSLLCTSAVVRPCRFMCYRRLARIIRDFRFICLGQLEISALPENMEAFPREGKQTAYSTYFTWHVLISRNLHPRSTSKHQSAYSCVQKMEKKTQMR